MKVMLKNVRLSFPALWKAKSFSPDAPAYFQAAFLLPKTSPQVKAIAAAERKVMADKWGKKADDEQFRRRLARRALRDGGEKDQYAGYSDEVYYISANSKNAPLVIDANRSPLQESEGRPYAGCYVNAQVTIWAQDNQYGKAINVEVNGVQFVGHGESFGGGSGAASVEDFEDESGEEPETETVTEEELDPLA